MDAKELLQEVSDKVGRAANVKASFGEPVGEGRDSVIPVARVSVRGGGGGGTGEMPEGKKGMGKGLGIGLNVSTTPVGYIKRTEKGAAYVPIVDRNRMYIAAAVVAGLGLLVARAGIRMFGPK